MKKGIMFILTVLIILVILEVFLRSFAYKPHQSLVFDDIECDGLVWQIPYDSIGYVFYAGEFNCLVNKTINFQVTQNDDLSRKTSKEKLSCDKIIHFYGDSFIWGQSLNDDQTLAWQVQNVNDEICIKNYGVGAYSSVQSFLLFKENLGKDQIPQEVFLFYSGFLDDRNAFTSSWKNLWQDLLADLKESGEFKLKAKVDFYFPMATIDNDSLIFKFLNEEQINNSFPLRRTLASANMIDILIENYTDKQKTPHRVSIELFKKFYSFSVLNNISFTLVLIDENSLNSADIAELKDFGMSIIDISFELNAAEHTFYPVDMHPNEEANRIWAEKLIPYIN
jgi:hypothetical protein